MYHLACKYLPEHGYPQYEISNFSQKNFESRHNLNFWKGKDFIGIGLSAASFFNSQEWENTNTWKNYLAGDVPTKRKLSSSELKINKLLLNIRLNRGVATKQINSTKLKSLLESKLISIKEKKIYLTPKGQDLENQVSQIIYS